MIGELCESLNTQDVLDYGCGKQTLKEKLPFVRGYDPAIEGLDSPPEPADVVVCTDVLEHIEPECIDAVMDDLARLTRRVLFATFATEKAMKHLPDGRNAHLIVRPARWWMPKFWDRFSVKQMTVFGTETIVVAGAMQETRHSGAEERAASF